MDGLDRFASAMRAEVRRSVASRGLNSAQDAILRLLLARPAGLRVQVLADTSASASRPSTDSVIALERKGLVRRQADPADARATIVKVTPEALAKPAAAVPSLAAAALADLSEAEQVRLLKTLLSLSGACNSAMQFRLSGFASRANISGRMCIRRRRRHIIARSSMRPSATARCASIAPNMCRPATQNCAQLGCFMTPRPHHEARP